MKLNILSASNIHLIFTFKFIFALQLSNSVMVTFYLHSLEIPVCFVSK